VAKRGSLRQRSLRSTYNNIKSTGKHVVYSSDVNFLKSCSLESQGMSLQSVRRGITEAATKERQNAVRVTPGATPFGCGALVVRMRW
jgi:hypothetical protein